MIPRLALLGALRHYKRSLVVVGAAAVACAVMITIGSLLNGVSGGFYDSVIPNSGHVRIDDARTGGALNPFSLRLLIDDADLKVARIKALGDKRIVDVEPVLSFGALLVEDSAGGEPRSLAMRAMGLDPATRFADNVRYSLVSGSFLPEGEGIALSESAARLVGTGLGRGVLVLVQDSGGQPWYEKLTVTGIFRTESTDFDETTFYIGGKKSEEMLDVVGKAREIRLLLGDRDDADAVAKDIAKVLDPGAALRVLSWQSINATIFVLLLFIRVLLGIVMGLFAIVAGTIIANTSLMSVMERLREFGTMRAIGLRASALERLILFEGGILGMAGALLGVALGSVCVSALAQGGIDLGGAMENLGLSRYNKPRPDLLWYLACTFASLFVSLVATARAAGSVKAMSVADSLATAA
ncbi:MAG: FtsX-like permease family protein [Spirochaetota bacterium]